MQLFLTYNKYIGYQKLANADPTDDNVTIAVKKYESHTSIKMIKRTIGNDKKFEFTCIYPNEICSPIKRLNTSKSVSGQIPSIWKSAIDIYVVIN